MKKYIAIFREPEGRTKPHSEDETRHHQLNWKTWFEKWGKDGRIIDGSGLTLNGRIIFSGDNIQDKIHHSGLEIIGGFIVFKADDLNDATDMMKTCPLYEFDGYAEIRELQNQS